MIIICSGADSYKSIQKANELESAYRAKYDPEGLSVEHCEPNQSPVLFLQQRMGVGSLFAKRSFLRVSGLLSAKASEKKTLKALFAQPDEMTIVVDVEEGSLKASDLSLFDEGTGVVRYDFPEMKGATFEKWLQERATALNITDSSLVKSVAKEMDGDSWAAINTLIQVSCGYPLSNLSQQAEQVYQYTDAILHDSQKRFSFDSFRQFDGSTLALLLSQSLQAERVKIGDETGIHPYVASKLKQLGPTTRAVLVKAIESHILVRSGFAVDHEVNVLF